MIRIPQVRVVDEEGNQLGVMATPAALQMAQDRGLDLVEVAPMAVPPVVKFLDFGHYKYELTKREKEAKRRQRSVTFKEVRLTPKIGVGDFETKVHRAIEFLEEGDRIKVTVRFRGRELTHPELGRTLLQRFTEQIKDHGVAERTPIFEGKSMFLTVASTHKPKVHDAPARPQGEAGADGAASLIGGPAAEPIESAGKGTARPTNGATTPQIVPAPEALPAAPAAAPAHRSARTTAKAPTSPPAMTGE
jgi:translation initiation factor IF-3